jgi:capsular polysaccharide biosynthesis protein
MSDGDRSALGLSGWSDGPERLWLDGDTAAEDEAADLGTGLVSLGFIKAALRRSKWLCAAMAIAGLIIGSGLYLSSPPHYQASSMLLLTVGPEAQPGTAVLDNQAIAQSRAVAALALQQLGMRQDVGSFLGSYAATVVTDRVLRITATAKSSNQAVTIANAVAAAFLSFRADQLREQQRLQAAALDQQVTLGQQRVKSITEQISQLSAQPASSSQQATLSSLRTQSELANSDLTALKEAANSSNAAGQTTVASMITGSKVIDAASPLAHSRYKGLVLYAAAGFIAGLVLGVGIVVVRALTSDRLYRRDDVSRALGAPVKLSIPATRATRRLKGRRGLAAAKGRDVQRIVAHLRGAGQAGPHNRTALAVVPVDDPQVAALCVASLAMSCAQKDGQVVLADLCSGSPAAKLLGVKGPGVQPVSVAGGHLVAIIPEPEEVALAGPLGPASQQAQSELAGRVADACASADLLLVLAALDPATGAEHLSTWATDAVVVVTAGRSSWSKIQAVGEMIRLAGTRLVSAVLVGSDKRDESLGLTRTPQAGRGGGVTDALPPDAKSSVATPDGGPDGRPPTEAPVSRLISR